MCIRLWSEYGWGCSGLGFGLVCSRIRMSGLGRTLSEGPVTGGPRRNNVPRRDGAKTRKVELPATYLPKLELEGGFGLLSVSSTLWCSWIPEKMKNKKFHFSAGDDVLPCCRAARLAAWMARAGTQPCTLIPHFACTCTLQTKQPIGVHVQPQNTSPKHYINTPTHQSFPP